MLKPDLPDHREKVLSTELLDRSKWGEEMGHKNCHHHHLLVFSLLLWMKHDGLGRCWVHLVDQALLVLKWHGISQSWRGRH